MIENYYKQIGFSKENSYCSMKRLKKKDLLLLANKLREKKYLILVMLKNTISLYQKKNTKLIKQAEIITYQPKTFENPNIVDITSIITEHPKTSHKLSKTIRQAEKVGSNSSLDSNAKKVKIF